MRPPFVDIHCHILPCIDDGADDQAVSLAMARMAIEDGVRTIIATPHQLGSFSVNRGQVIRTCVEELQRILLAEQLPLRVLPGGDVRIEDGMIAGLESGDVVTLGDHRRHVLLELPHELYFPLEPLVEQLSSLGMVGILSHPERNREILRAPALVAPLVDAGCLMQITAGSLLGRFGPASQCVAEKLIATGLVHFLATDAHGVRSRRPVLGGAYQRVRELVGEAVAVQICCENPRLVAEGSSVALGRIRLTAGRRGWRRLISFKRAA